MITKNHHFFMLPFSPWPFFSSIMSLNFAVSLVLFFKFSFLLSIYFSFSMFLFCSFSWWLSYLKEFHFLGLNSHLLDSALKISMVLFIFSEIFFFFSFFWSYFHFFLSPFFDLGGSFPSFGLIMFYFLGIPVVNTLLLLSSGLTVTLAHKYFVLKNYVASSKFVFFTVFLGVIFSFLQLIEYKNSFFSISDSSFGSIFFLLTGFHGFHVIIGSFYIFFCLLKSSEIFYSRESLVSFEMSSWYWHFVDVVWIFLYFFLYFLNS